MLLKLWREHMPRRWAFLVIVIIAQVVQCLASLWLPTLNADIINDGIVGQNLALIWKLGGIMLVATVIQTLGMVVSAYFSGRIAMWIGRDVRQKVYDQVLTFSSSQMHHFGSASLITRATNDINQVQSVILMTLIIMIQAPIMGVGAVIMAVSLDAPLSLLFLVAVPVLLVVVCILMHFMSPLFKVQQERIDAVAARIRGALSGVRIVRAFGRKQFMNERFDTANRDLRDVALRLGNLFALMIPAVQLIVMLSSIGVIWFGAGRYFSGQMEIGDIVAFLTYLMQLLGAVMMASFMFVMVPRAEVCAKRLSEVISTLPEISTPRTPVAFPAGPLTLSFKGVSVGFAGASRPLLQDLNFRIEPGQSTAIIGSTGSGKTSLLRLMMRSLDPTAGQITVNGVDLRDLDLDQWHRHIAYVPQNSYLFSGTIASTVSGMESAQITSEVREKVWAALRQAQAEDFVSALDGGVDAEVSAGGKNFSGGQRQRLSVARALFRGSTLVFLDDPFSALDFATEAKLRGELNSLEGPVSLIFVAQRIASVRHADQIIVLDEGRMVGLGTHEQLLADCGAYQEIVESQLSLEEVQ